MAATKSPPKSANPTPMTFVCSKCERRKPLKTGNGKGKENNFFTMPNGDQSCTACVREDEQAAWKKGVISLFIEWEKPGWVARSRTGEIQFPLIPAANGSAAATVLTPRFSDETGRVWSGRVYPTTGVASFQRSKKTAGQAKKARGRPRNEPAAV